MATGTVKWYNPAKRFGFIKPDDGSSDVFVHVSALEQAGFSMLDEGQRLQYDLAENKGKMSAVNLKIAN
jgi:CspA family cold shock protein